MLRWNAGRQVGAPTLLVTGTVDVITPPQNSVMLAGLIRGSWLAQFPGGGHGMMYQQPTRLGQLVRFFLQ